LVTNPVTPPSSLRHPVCSISPARDGRVICATEPVARAPIVRKWLMAEKNPSSFGPTTESRMKRGALSASGLTMSETVNGKNLTARATRCSKFSTVRIPQSDSYVKALSLHYEKCNPKRGQEKERNGQIAGRKENSAETDYRDEAGRHVAPVTSPSRCILPDAKSKKPSTYFMAKIAVAIKKKVCDL
jgi:hypothetical protein